MRGVSVAAMGFLALLASGAAQAQSQIGVWKVELGQKCGIAQVWKGDTGNTIGVGFNYMNKGEFLLLWFHDTDTTFKDKEEFKVGLQVDKGWRSKVDGYAFDKNTAAVILPASSDAIKALMNGKELSMTVAGKPDNYSGVYSLDDTRDAIGALSTCRSES